jgi:DNA-binding response OmpR family regulator
MHTRKILIVDDEEMSLFLLEIILVDEGFSLIDKAKDGNEALELFEDANLNDPYDAVFLDIQLPDMSGLEVLKRIRAFDEESDCRTTIIMATGDSSLATIQQSIMDLDADDYISKPYNRDEIHDALFKNGVISR